MASSETMGADNCGCSVKLFYDVDGYVYRVEVVRHCGND